MLTIVTLAKKIKWFMIKYLVLIHKEEFNKRIVTQSQRERL
jgi:hypothetical protein